jgi:hypothetical protein
MIYKTFNIAIISVFSIAVLLYGCNTNDKKENDLNYKKNIIGIWQEASSSEPSFKFTDSMFVILDTSLFGGECKYGFIKDTLCIKYSKKTTSKSKIILLNDDSLIISDAGALKTFRKIK